MSIFDQPPVFTPASPTNPVGVGGSTPLGPSLSSVQTTPVASPSGVNSSTAASTVTAPTVIQKMYSWLDNVIPTANAQVGSASTAGATMPQGTNGGNPAIPTGNDFSTAFAGLSPTEKANYMVANPNVNTTTGFPLSQNSGGQNYSINPGPTIGSNSTNGTMTTADALAAAASARAGLMNGTAPAGTVPSDNLYQSVVNGIFNASQYSPQELSALDQYNQTQAKIIQTQLAARRQILDLQQSGQITKAEGAAFITEAQRRSDAQLADLAASQAGNTLSLQTMGMLRQNQLGAYQNIASLIKPEQVAPGSTLVNPINGAPTYQGMGASPATIAGQAATFIAQDEATGNLNLNPDGTINQQYYQNKAQSYYSNGLIPGQNQGGASNGTVVGGPTSGVAALPPNVANQPYVIPASQNAPAYINLGRVPTGQQQYVATVAGKAGIPVLSADDASNVQGIQYTQQALQPLEQVMNQVLAPGVTGRGINVAKNFINDIFQNQPQLVAFNQARSTAIKVIQSLAAGSGSGFRLTQPEIDTATNNMPTANDNLETAQTKLAYVKSYLANELNLKITGNANNYVPPNTNNGGTVNVNPFSPSNFYGQ